MGEVQQLQMSLDSTNELLKKAMEAARTAEEGASKAGAAAAAELEGLKACLAEAAGVLNAKEELREARCVCLLFVRVWRSLWLAPDGHRPHTLCGLTFSTYMHTAQPDMHMACIHSPCQGEAQAGADGAEAGAGKGAAGEQAGPEEQGPEHQGACVACVRPPWEHL
jgi:hypothetical protein